MRKDYIAVSDEVANFNEINFVEDFWSERWNDLEIDERAAEAVRQSEEFKIISPYINQLPKGARILDGGCGLGEWTIFFSAQHFDTYGLDISQSIIERLQKHFPAKNFFVGDVRHTEFDDGFFDGYFSWGTFEHFEEGLGSCLSEANRILNTGGYLFLSIPFHNTRHWNEDKRELEYTDALYESSTGYKSPMRFYQWRLTRRELERELEIHRFRALEIKPIHKWEGVNRLVQRIFNTIPEQRIHVLLQRLLYCLTTRNFVSHMLLSVGEKR